MHELCRILQKPRHFIDDAAVKWETKSEVLVKYASEVESVSNSKLRLLLCSLSETGRNDCYLLCSIYFVSDENLSMFVLTYYAA